MGTPKNSEVTRAKLIEAASRLFAERGFRGVTVRDIAQEAQTHLSALNYHFRTKEALYREVLMEACKAASISSEDQEQLLELNPLDALFLVVKESLKGYQSHAASHWQSVIITRECWEPSQVFQEVVQKYFKPQTDFLTRIIGNIVNKPPDEYSVHFAVFSLIGLLETFGLYGHLFDAIAPELSDQFRRRDSVAKQIVHLVVEAADPSSEE